MKKCTPIERYLMARDVVNRETFSQMSRNFIKRDMMLPLNESRKLWKELQFNLFSNKITLEQLKQEANDYLDMLNSLINK